DQVDRDEVDEVHQQHPHEDGQAQRREKAAVAVEQVLDLAIDEFHDQLDEGLALARHAGRGLARETIEPDEENGAYEQAHDPAVEMEIASEHLHVVEVDMVLDVFVQAAATFRGLHQHHDSLNLNATRFIARAATTPMIAGSAGRCQTASTRYSPPRTTNHFSIAPISTRIITTPGRPRVNARDAM